MKSVLELSHYLNFKFYWQILPKSCEQQSKWTGSKHIIRRKLRNSQKWSGQQLVFPLHACLWLFYTRYIEYSIYSMCVYIDIYTYIYIHTHTHAYTYMYTDETDSHFHNGTQYSSILQSSTKNPIISGCLSTWLDMRISGILSGLFASGNNFLE